MEINDALVTAITRELLRRLRSGEITFSESGDESNGACPGPVCATPAAAASVHPVNPVQPQGRRRVISEAEIMRLCPSSAGTGQNVEIRCGDIITPLAEDYIAKMRITVNRIG